MYPVATQVDRAATHGLDWLVITDHGNVPFATHSIPPLLADIVAARRAYRDDVLIFTGLEWNIPAGEHTTLMLAPGPNEAALLQEFVTRFDARVNGTRNGTPENEAIALQAKIVETQLQNVQEAEGYLVTVTFTVQLWYPGEYADDAEMFDAEMFGITPREAAGMDPKQLEVEITETVLMRQGDRTLLHLINLSGHFSTAYHAPLPMTEISLEVDGEFQSATALRSGVRIPVARAGNFTRIVLPRLNDYEVVVLE